MRVNDIRCNWRFCFVIVVTQHSTVSKPTIRLLFSVSARPTMRREECWEQRSVWLKGDFRTVLAGTSLKPLKRRNKKRNQKLNGQDPFMELMHMHVWIFTSCQSAFFYKIVHDWQHFQSKKQFVIEMCFPFLIDLSWLSYPQVHSKAPIEATAIRYSLSTLGHLDTMDNGQIIKKYTQNISKNVHSVCQQAAQRHEGKQVAVSIC